MKKLSWFQIFRATFRRDLTGLSVLIRTDFKMARLRRSNASVTSVFKQNVIKNPSKVIMVNQYKEWSAKEVDEFSNKVANYFISRGFKKGDEVALMMKSAPEYVAIWLGLSKAGLVTALINTNQRSKVLVHSLTTINAKAVICDYDHLNPVAYVVGDVKKLNPRFDFYLFDVNTWDQKSNNNKSSVPNDFHVMSKNWELSPIHLQEVKNNFTDKLLYVYTSGTTGLPKAAIVKHSKYLTVGVGIHYIMDVKPEDVLYTCLPLYHYAGGMMGTSQSLVYFNKIAIREKFSVSNYWEECIKYNATIGQYIGELCRYLYSQPEKNVDTKHSIKTMFGNGMRPQMSANFAKRFNIKRIAEVYGTSEGNAQIVSLDDKAGTCGFLSRALPKWIAKRLYPVSLIKVDNETGDPIRDSKGMAIHCEPGEIGMFVGKIVPKDPIRSFDGYSNEKATAKKIIKDVFVRGDQAYASGDLLVMDELGYCYFVDRTGDTFRWKGENVSTTEVESIISGESGQVDCIVFPVSIPNHEGKTGMAVIKEPKLKDPKEMNQLLSRLQKSLPFYAIPSFVRAVDQIEMTSTMKIPKVEYQKQGYDVNLIKGDDKVYYYSKKDLQYHELTSEKYQKIISGQITF